MTLTQLNRLFTKAARLSMFAEAHPKCAAAAFAGRCRVTPVEDVKIPKKNAIPVYAWDNYKGSIVNLRYWKYPYPRNEDEYGVNTYDFRLVPPGIGRNTAFPIVPRRLK